MALGGGGHLAGRVARQIGLLTGVFSGPEPRMARRRCPDTPWRRLAVCEPKFASFLGLPAKVGIIGSLAEAAGRRPDGGPRTIRRAARLTGAPFTGRAASKRAPERRTGGRTYRGTSKASAGHS